jgi:hypothetical protein
MNQRREPRLEANQPVRVTLFGEPDIRLLARVKNVSRRGMGFEIEGPVSTGTAVRIDIDDAFFLGEVIYCRQDESSFYVGVELEQVLFGLTDLAQILGAFSDSPSGPEQTHPVIERRYQN